MVISTVGGFLRDDDDVAGLFGGLSGIRLISGEGGSGDDEVRAGWGHNWWGLVTCDRDTRVGCIISVIYCGIGGSGVIVTLLAF